MIEEPKKALFLFKPFPFDDISAMEKNVFQQSFCPLRNKIRIER